MVLGYKQSEIIFHTHTQLLFFIHNGILIQYYWVYSISFAFYKKMKYAFCILSILVAFVHSNDINNPDVQTCKYAYVYITAHMYITSCCKFSIQNLKWYYSIQSNRLPVVEQIRNDFGPIERGENAEMSGHFDVYMQEKVKFRWWIICQN